MENYLTTIVNEVQEVLDKVDRNELNKLTEIITNDRRIFVDGAGRSGFIGKCFAMRLMHLGYEVYVLGETTTPSFESTDVYISISGSGNTSSVLVNAKKAEKSNCVLATITNNKESSLGEMSEYVLELDATVRGDKEERFSIQLLGSLFDQSVHLILDNICLAISKKEQISNEKASEKHV